jgi:hypothetical protein
MIDLNQLSLRYSTAVHGLRNEARKGAELIPLILDYVLRDCCSEQVVQAFVETIRWPYSGGLTRPDKQA